MLLAVCNTFFWKNIDTSKKAQFNKILFIKRDNMY